MGDASTAVVIPVKDFARAKLRLSGRLEPAEREDLARRMAETVVKAAGSLPVHIVCDSETITDWATTVGASVLWTPGLGLNGAVQEGVRRLADAGIERVIVAHSDLPLAEDLGWVGATAGVTLVPDRALDGTNVLSIPAAAGFRFAYGHGSFRAHWQEATRLGLVVRIVRDASLSWDVDQPDDLLFPTTPRR